MKSSFRDRGIDSHLCRPYFIGLAKLGRPNFAKPIEWLAQVIENRAWYKNTLASHESITSDVIDSCDDSH